MRSEGVRGENPEKADCVCLAVIVKHIHIQTLPQEPPWDQVPGTAQGYWEKMAAKKTEERELQKGPGASEHPALSTDFVSTPISCPPGLFPPTPVFCSEFSRTHTNLFWLVLTPSSQTTHPPPNHVTKASLIYLGLLRKAIQDAPCLSSLPWLLKESKGPLFGVSASSYSHLSFWTHFHFKV